MRRPIAILSLLLPAACMAQTRNIVGTFAGLPTITFHTDSTFSYTSTENPNFFLRPESFSEHGRWTVSGDTVILNPNLQKLPFIESELQEQEIPGSTDLTLTFNHIKRYIDSNGNITGADTSQIQQLDYFFDKFKKKALRRISVYPSSHCTFAGYVPKEIVTTNRTITVKRPSENIRSLFVGCYEQKGFKEFVLRNPRANHLVFNVYSNYYQNAQLRRVKLLIKDDNALYTVQKKNGAFKKDNMWSGPAPKLTRQKDNS